MWREAFITPILKANKPISELYSYRPISLTSILHKQASGDTAQQTSKLLCLARKLKDSLDRKEAMLAVFVDCKVPVTLFGG
jgi:hypothetical protein